MSEPYFSIVVPTFRRPDALRDALVALLAVEYPRERYELIVVDDGAEQATDKIIAPLRGQGVEITLAAQDHRGAASARNRGARLAGGDLLLFVDDDIVVGSGHLQRHRETQERYGDALVNGAWEFAPHVLRALRETPFGRYRIDLERSFQNKAAGTPVAGDCMEMALVGSWDLAVQRELFWDLGGFDERFPVAGAEDQDLSIRARSAGCRLLLNTGIRCLHNDNRLTLRAYCAREERSAQTMPLLARKYPEQLCGTPYVVQNRPVSRRDPPRLVTKKLLKSLLATRVALALLHRAIRLLEAARLPDTLLRRLYSGLLGLHLFRGFRRAWA